MMVSIEMKDLTAKPTGLHGTLDGGASCMVLEHETLMHYIEHYHTTTSARHPRHFSSGETEPWTLTLIFQEAWFLSWQPDFKSEA